ncbi:MAG TPA: hypothetical protein VEV63_17990 [Streptosporangiaceae bacterium]|nr:hypothetical protein [Streptosporangiaceae bacterium]
MPTDYDAIRAENIARYGWDTAVLELLGQLYSDRTHFIFELVQNAEDAGATELTFELFGDRLEVRHDGRPFDAADVRGICGVSQGTKADDVTQIGKFGIGFKSVYAYTNTPVISSGDEHFRIEKYVRPHPAAALPAPERLTLFVFPFDRAEVPADVAVAEISAAFGALNAEMLLFLRNIGEVRASGAGVADTVLRRMAAAQGSGCVLSTRRGERRSDEEWKVWSRSLADLGEPDLRVEIAFAVRSEADVRRLVRRESSPLVVFFPTEKETYLGFAVQGPYRTTPARDNVPEHDSWNQALVTQTAGLLSEVLTELRDDGLLTADILQALPIDAARFSSGTMFSPLFASVRDAFLQANLIPDTAGGYRLPAQVRLARGSGVRELLTPQQLGRLCGSGAVVAFVDESVSQTGTPLLWRYLRDEIGVAEVTPEFVVESATEEFLSAQSDDWIARFYAFLHQHHSLWLTRGPTADEPGQALARPIIRLQDGTHVLPFDARGRPAAYLPGPVATEFPTVRRVIAGQAEARRFLDALGFAEVDVLSEVIDRVLPRYEDAEAESLDAAKHDADLELVSRALVQTGPADRERLLERLAETTFLVGENARTGGKRLMRPADLYQRTRALELYFDRNPDAWFAADSYGPWLAQLRMMGVREQVRVDARQPDELGYVVIADEFARHERGTAGFDPGAGVDGLAFALDHPSLARSEFVWNALLVPNRHLIAGVVESSPRLGFVDASRERRLSAVGELAVAAAWLPSPDGTFLRPADIDVAELPDSFASDDLLAEALGMTKPVIDEANRQLGFPSGFLRRLGKHPDLVAAIERELSERELGGRPPIPPAVL